MVVLEVAPGLVPEVGKDMEEEVLEPVQVAEERATYFTLDIQKTLRHPTLLKREKKAIRGAFFSGWKSFPMVA